MTNEWSGATLGRTLARWQTLASTLQPMAGSRPRCLPRAVHASVPCGSVSWGRAVSRPPTVASKPSTSNWRRASPARGHRVAVYNRPHVVGTAELREYLGVRLHHLPSMPTKHLDTISTPSVSVLHGALQRFDIVYVCGVGNTPVAWVPACSVLGSCSMSTARTGSATKWGGLASRYLRFVEGSPASSPTSSSPTIRPSGTATAPNTGSMRSMRPMAHRSQPDTAGTRWTAFGLTPDGYVLWVGRLEPETRVEELIEAFSRAGLEGRRLVILGDAPFAQDYRDRLHALATRTSYSRGTSTGPPTAS